MQAVKDDTIRRLEKDQRQLSEFFGRHCREDKVRCCRASVQVQVCRIPASKHVNACCTSVQLPSSILALGCLSSCQGV